MPMCFSVGVYKCKEQCGDIEWCIETDIRF